MSRLCWNRPSNYYRLVGSDEAQLVSGPTPPKRAKFLLGPIRRYPSEQLTSRQGLLIMRMPMMDVRIVRTGVGQLAVVMDVRVGLTWRVARLVQMLMVLVPGRAPATLRKRSVEAHRWESHRSR